MNNARQIFHLNGKWDIQPGSRETQPLTYMNTVSVPGLVDLSEPHYNWNETDYHWYRKIITIPDKYHRDRIYLKIGQAFFGTAVWINGNHAGDNIACYTSQEYPVERFMQYGKKNEIVVRVGAKRALPEISAVGNDYEKAEFIPGVWGDVDLICHDNPGVKNIQIIPHIDESIAEARIELENFANEPVDCEINIGVFEKEGKIPGSGELQISSTLPAGTVKIETVKIPLQNLKLWSPEAPFLYELHAEVLRDGKSTDYTNTRFGMREFRVCGGDFYLNGKKIYLRGGNIAFHRFLSDPERGSLPWNSEWIKRLLIDIPKSHNFNFFRNHLGQLYNKWYDIADEYGMLIQNEWQFWGVTGSEEQITAEFTQWLRDNRNHPSIVIWDALNETRNEMIELEIVPDMKKIDPTRPWEPVDFVEDHPYIYSLGPVLNDRQFGHTRSLDEIENLEVPSVLNEFVWWWLDADDKPTKLTRECIVRWLGPEYTAGMLVEHQCFLIQELVELFRRMRIDAIQPFVYLSSNDGPTAHWFYSPIKDLKPKPILKQLKNAFEAFGVSIELWDRHFFEGEKRKVNIFVFNDTRTEQESILKYGFTDSGGKWIQFDEVTIKVPAVDTVVKSLDLSFPDRAGTYYVKSELLHPGSEDVAYSSKIAHVFSRDLNYNNDNTSKIVVLDSRSNEMTEFLNSLNIACESFHTANLNDDKPVVIAEGMVRHESYTKRIHEISSFVRSGGTLVLIEPELELNGNQVLSFDNGVTIDIERRTDKDKGGYDSYIFPVDHDHPLWKGIDPEHLKMFNGAYGGEIISQHDVVPRTDHTVLARCGLQLNVIAVTEIPAVKGRIIISRLQLRGRLMENKSNNNGLYARRVDPVAQRYFLNLISLASRYD